MIHQVWLTLWNLWFVLVWTNLNNYMEKFRVKSLQVCGNTKVWTRQLIVPGTEKGSYTSGVKCLKCSGGYCLPSCVSDEFRCDKCGQSVPGFQVQMQIKMWDPIVQAITTFQSTGIEEKLGLICQLGKSFKRNTQCVEKILRLWQLTFFTWACCCI